MQITHTHTQTQVKNLRNLKPYATVKESKGFRRLRTTKFK